MSHAVLGVGNTRLQSKRLHHGTIFSANTCAKWLQTLKSPKQGPDQSDNIIQAVLGAHMGAK